MDFLAGSVTPTSLSVHTRNLDEGLKIWMDLLNNSAFPEDKLRREKDLALPSIRNRNKNVSTVTSRTYSQLIYGEDSPIAAEMTEAGVNSITREDLIGWHKEYWGANNAILVVSGDFQMAEMMQKLEATIGKWRCRRFPTCNRWPRPASTWCNRRSFQTRVSCGLATWGSCRTIRTFRQST